VLAVPAAASAATKTVYAGGPPRWSNAVGNKYGVTINDFLLRNVTIHVGDSIKFSNLAGGFHNVELGGNTAAIIPELGTVSGVNDAAGNPFWFSLAHVSNVGFNPALISATSSHTFNGHGRVASAVPAAPNSPDTFTVRFTKTGRFNFHCDIHHGMGGTVKVLTRRAHIPSARDDAKALAKQEAADLAAAKRAAKPHVPTNTVLVGSASSNGVEALSFFPHTLDVAVGTTVKFTMTRGAREFHTASTVQVPFTGSGQNIANAYLDPIVNTPPPLFDPRLVYPSDSPLAGVASLTATSHGNGFWNSGGLDENSSTPTVPASNSVKFNAPGTYNFVCLIHYPFMHGTVVVHG
jgi:plastocyanin